MLSLADQITYHSCRECKYVFTRPLTFEIDPEVLCPNCNHIGLLLDFPGFSAEHWISNIDDLYPLADKAAQIRQEELRRDVARVTRKLFDSQQLVNIANEMQSRYVIREVLGKNIAFNMDGYEEEESYEWIQRKLSLPTIDQAMRVWSDFFHFPRFGSASEDKQPVSMICSLLETMYRNLLSNLGANPKGSIPVKDKCFKAHTGITRQEASAKVGFGSFCQDWDEIRTKRNEFIHASPYAIDAKTIRKAKGLFENCVAYFAALQNQYVLTPTSNNAS